MKIYSAPAVTELGSVATATFGMVSTTIEASGGHKLF